MAFFQSNNLHTFLNKRRQKYFAAKAKALRPCPRLQMENRMAKKKHNQRQKGRGVIEDCEELGPPRDLFRREDSRTAMERTILRSTQSSKGCSGRIQGTITSLHLRGSWCRCFGRCACQKRWQQCQRTAKTKYGNFETNIPRKGILGYQSQFPHSRVCE